MITEYWVILSAVLAWLVVCAVAYGLIQRKMVRQLSAALRTAEKAYAELTAQSAVRERQLRDEIIQYDRRDTLQVQALAQITTQFLETNRLVDQLVTTVRQYAKDIRETMVLMKDETPPKELVAAEEALRLHDEQLKIRNQK